MSNNLDLSHIGGSYYYDDIINCKIMQPDQNNSLLPRNILLYSLIIK